MPGRMISHLGLCSLCFLQSCSKSLINHPCSRPYWENSGLCSLCFLQSCSKSLINHPCSRPYWENSGPRSFLYDNARCDNARGDRPHNPNRHETYVVTFYISALTSISFKDFPLLFERIGGCLKNWRSRDWFCMRCQFLSKALNWIVIVDIVLQKARSLFFLCCFV